MTAAAERPLYGAALIVGGMCVIGFIDNFVSVFATHAGLGQFHFLRSAIAVPAIFLVALAMAKWKSKSACIASFPS